MATLTVTPSTRTGATLTFATADGDGDQFVNDGRTLLIAHNMGSGTATVSVTSQRRNRGLIMGGASATIASGDSAVIGKLDTATFNDAGKYARITYAYDGGDIAFPSTAVLDDFNRADEGPPPSVG